MAMLDENRKQANIYSFEWLWDVDKPSRPKRRLENVGEEEDDDEDQDDLFDSQDDEEEELDPDGGQSTKPRRTNTR